MKKGIKDEGKADPSAAESGTKTGRLLIHPLAFKRKKRPSRKTKYKTDRKSEKRLKPEYISMIQSLLF